MAILEGTGTIQIVSSFTAVGGIDLTPSALSKIIFLTTGNMVSNPKVSSAVAKTAYKTRITFDQQMTNDSKLVALSNYKLTPTSLGVYIYVTAVEKENVPNPTYVDVTTNEMTGGQGYQVSVTGGVSGPISRLGLRLNSLSNVASYVGIGENPWLYVVKSMGVNRANVIFNEPMLDNAPIRDPLKYVFDNGLLVLGVLDVDVDTVKLITSDQSPNVLYTLTIG